ncbi:tRNA (guanosine(37)-N1)-methyltransferase TrmD [Actinomyces sp. B33]|uniref:tRNA (guanosine(37)-N1)-methyltransferase TrmD n=1 Tax=Actinomyces sp. B33 TaxID=2942131 RepID=UPI0023422953|nr:tRNA (guanosine(37)-N1)-methyltransferase TrmD [Actinomyces sp. B33]MDC4232952.1 tRNA (guanosine(37)-N1)-methyltransferase TrmD [Actinomyces sp. B33]
MRIDLVTIFPQYFTALDLSLIGRAGQSGLLDLRVHDLRGWTTDRHHSVDDAPYGGGAGMVMRPDVWGRALDEVLAQDPRVDEASTLGARRVLAIPTPSGSPLTQAMAEDLAGADHLVVACGRYEGIDQRVADYYRDAGREVVEYSIGDYVLNGGEAAALVLVEAVTRLLDGFMGNPESLVEESHSAGILEYPAYTRPRSWRGLEVPEVLLGGDHGAIRRWRQERAIDRTVERRPDLVEALPARLLDGAAREHLASRGYAAAETGARPLAIRPARPDEAPRIAALARRTFPLACPDSLPAEAIEDFCRTELSDESFDQMLADPAAHRILVAQVDADLVGYTLTVLSGPRGLPDGLVGGRIAPGAAYLSKCYVDEAWHGSGIAGALLEEAVVDVERTGAASQIVLGTNEANTRAQRFYRRHGFSRAGRRVFVVGGVENRDVVLVRKLTTAVPR